MKNLVLLLLVAPIFLMTALNFHAGNEDTHHYENNRFTCTACHATIIDGIIVGGKDETDNVLELELFIPNEYAGQNIVFSGNNNPRIRDLSSVSEYTSNSINEYLIVNVEENQLGKKENTITIQLEISAADRAAGYIEMQGVLSNLDGTNANDFAFSKKISIENKQEQLKEPAKLFPTVAQNFIQLENLSTNTSVAIFNAIGKQVYNKTSTSNTEKINVSGFEKGNYFVLINKNEQLKFIVNN